MPALLLVAVLLLTGCSAAVSGKAIGVSSPSTPATGPTAATAELASTGPRIAVPKKADTVAPCALASAQQVGRAFSAVSGPPAALRGNSRSCVWPLDSGANNGFLVGYGLAYDEVQGTHPTAQGAFERTTDGNSTWLWCDVSDQTGAFSCGAAVAITAEETFVTGLVRSPGAGRTKTAVLAELQTITIPLFRSLPAL